MFYSSRAVLSAVLVLAILISGYALSQSFHRFPDEAAVIEGQLVDYFRVDSEHGDLNGWFSPEIIYDIYVKQADGQERVLWATPDTVIYRELGDGNLVKISIRDFEKVHKVRAYVGKIDQSYPRPAAFAVKIIALD